MGVHGESSSPKVVNDELLIVKGHLVHRYFCLDRSIEKQLEIYLSVAAKLRACVKEELTVRVVYLNP